MSLTRLDRFWYRSDNNDAPPAAPVVRWSRDLIVIFIMFIWRYVLSTHNRSKPCYFLNILFSWYTRHTDDITHYAVNTNHRERKKERKKNTLTCTIIIHPCALKPSQIFLAGRKAPDQPTVAALSLTPKHSSPDCRLDKARRRRGVAPIHIRPPPNSTPRPHFPPPFSVSLHGAPLFPPPFSDPKSKSPPFISPPPSLRPTTTSSIPLLPPPPPSRRRLLLLQTPTSADRSIEPVLRSRGWPAVVARGFLPVAEICGGGADRAGTKPLNPRPAIPRSATRSGCGGRSRGSPELRGGACRGSADPGAGHELLGREGERIAGSRRAPGRRQPAQGLHRLQHHQDAALARRALRTHVAVQRVRDPVQEEAEGGDGPRGPPQEEAAGGGRRARGGGGGGVLGGRRRERGSGAAAAAAAQEEDDDDQEGARGGAPRRRVRQGGGAEAAAADAAQAAAGRGGEGGHPPDGPLLRRHLRLIQAGPTPPS